MTNNTFVLAYILPTLIVIVAAIGVYIWGKKIDSSLSTKINNISKVIGVGTNIAEYYFKDNNNFNKVKELVNLAVYNVEELSKTNKMTSDEKHQTAKKIYYKMCDELGLNEYSKLSESVIDGMIKACVYIMNKEYNNK